MREIKFRARIEDVGKMHPKGTYFYQDNQYLSSFINRIYWHYGVTHPKYLKHENGELFELESILERFTGLKDKNGKEIYEGDIIQWGNDVVQVLYQTKSMSFVFGKKGWLSNHFVEEMNDIHEAEIIGNIYENQELLK